MKVLNGDMILPKFGECSYYNEAGSKPDFILFWARDIVAVYKKDTQMIINFSNIDINEMSRIHIVVVGDHGLGASRFPMKILYIMNIGKSDESIQPVDYL